MTKRAPSHGERTGAGVPASALSAPLTYEDVCGHPDCSAPNDESWHHCWVCQNPAIDHAHVISRARAPGRKHDADNLVALCRAHHDAVDLHHTHGHAVRRLGDGLLHYFYWQSTPYKELVDRVIGAGLGRNALGAEESATAEGNPDPTPPPRSAHPVLGDGGQRRASGDRKVVRATRAQTPHPLPPLSDHWVIGDGSGTKKQPSGYAVEDGASPAPIPDHPPEAQERPQDGDPEHPTAEIVPVTVMASDGTPSVSYERRALIIEGPLSWERYESICYSLQTMHEAVGFWIGDLILAGEREFGERCYQPWSNKEFSVERIKGYAWVASRIPPVARVTELSFTHHREVAALEPEQQVEMLALAEAQGLSTRELHDAVKPKAACSHLWEDITISVCRKCGGRKD